MKLSVLRSVELPADRLGGGTWVADAKSRSGRINYSTVQSYMKRRMT